jgi:osmotically-inducible protein OsmY
MRFGAIIFTLALVSGCTAFVVGGGGGYQPGKDDRGSAVISSDATVTTRIKDQFAADSLLRNYAIAVRTYNGTVTLTGTVDKAAARDQAGRIAQGAGDAIMVNNQIVVDTRSNPR